MTEKRFKSVFSGRYNDVFIGVKDNKEDELLMTLDTIDKLNELSTENEQLKHDIKNLKITIEARETLIDVCEKKFRELGYIITVDDDGYVIE